MDDAEARRLIQRLRQHAGRTYAAEAGITLRDTPMPLFQLMVLCMLASKPIDASIAMHAARELFRAGLRTPRAVLAANRQTMIDAFARAHYVRYDESSASRLTELAPASTTTTATICARWPASASPTCGPPSS